MSRNARRREPALRPKQRIELQEGNYALRLICLGVAITVAVLAFSAVLNGVLSPDTGWQQIEATNSWTGIGQDFLLCYNIGATDQDAEREQKSLIAAYSTLLDQGYGALTNTEQEGYVNLYSLNQQPNTALTVDGILYQALKTLEDSGSRVLYFAPLVGQYRSLFACTYDEAAELFDPERSEEAAEFAREIAAFAMDPEAISLQLLPENTVRLEISPEYLAYARENQVESFLDFGILMNAFLCDVVADGLMEQGFINGYVTSFDGYTRALCSDEFGLNVFDRVEGQTQQLGTVTYNAPGTVVSCRAFPILDKDSVNYYTYSDGTIRSPYLNEQGLSHCAAASLNTYSPTLSAGLLALRTLAAYAGADPDFNSLEDLSWVAGENQQIILHGEEFTLAE